MRKNKYNDEDRYENKNLSEAELERRKQRRKFIKRQRRLHVWTVIFIIILAIYVVIAGVGVYLIRDMTKDMPTLDIDDFVGDESSRIYDADGNLMIELGTYFRENVSYDEMPESLVDAFLSIEDSRFFVHNGFDVPRFTAAAISNVVSGDLTGQGGSTFTMQLVKNSYFSVDNGDNSTSYSVGRGIKYKVQQIILALELEKKLDKKEIFELYVNRLNFGQNIRGVEMASRYYFGKNVKELNLSESALLAGIVNLPNQYNPYYYLDYATNRRNQVLYMMLHHGYITEDEYELAKSIKVEDQLVGEYTDIKETNTTYQEYLDVVLSEAEEMTGYDPYNVGMDIYTAMDPDIQDLIMSIERGETNVTYADDLMQSAVCVMDHSNGEVVAVGGGRNYGSEGGSRLLNRATAMYKQPGSAVKPVLPYALGFEYLGFTIDETVADFEYSYPGESRTISDYDRKYKGVMSIKDAVADSRNIPAIMTLQLVQENFGTETIVDYMQSIGFDTVDESNFHLSCAIGAEVFSCTVEQLCAAHAAIMNFGVYNEPHTIRSIELSSGDTFAPQNQNQRVLSSGSAWLAQELMRNNVLVSQELLNYMQVLIRDWPTYAKTGTSDYDDSFVDYGIPEGSAKDEWMVSSNSRYTNAVWTGYDEAVAGEDTYFAQWKLYMNIAGKINSLLIDKEAEVNAEAAQELEKPDDLTEITYVKNTWPHVTEGNANGTVITSTCSTTGLKNTPQVDSMDEAYRVTAKGYVKGQNYDSGWSGSYSSSSSYGSSSTSTDTQTETDDTGETGTDTSGESSQADTSGDATTDTSGDGSAGDVPAEVPADGTEGQ